jgi:hypothetical protein
MDSTLLERVRDLEAANDGLRAAISKAHDRAGSAEKEACRYKKLYESATKRKHEIYSCLVAAKRALEEVV